MDVQESSEFKEVKRRSARAGERKKGAQRFAPYASGSLASSHDAGATRQASTLTGLDHFATDVEIVDVADIEAAASGAVEENAMDGAPEILRPDFPPLSAAQMLVRS